MTSEIIALLLLLIGPSMMVLVAIRGWKDLRQINRRLLILRAESERLRLEILRLSRRKQDWSPREDPALWRKE